MPALREQIKLIAAACDGIADQFLAVHVAFGRVDQIQPGVERVAEQASYGFRRGSLETNLRAAEAQHADVHIRFAILPFFHFSFLLFSDSGRYRQICRLSWPLTFVRGSLKLPFPHSCSSCHPWFLSVCIRVIRGYSSVSRINRMA